MLIDALDTGKFWPGRPVSVRWETKPLHYLAEPLETRLLLSLAPINPSDAVPFQQIVIDQHPGTQPVVKQLVDVTNSGHLDAVVGHADDLGGGGLFWYQYPASGNPADPWIKHTIDATADVYESARAADISGHVDSHGNPVNDLVVAEAGTIVWYENPLGDGLNPATAPWTKHVIGTITQGPSHDMAVADLDGDGKLDVAMNAAIFFQNSPTSWTRVAAPNYNRTEFGLSLFDSGSGRGSVDLLGTSNSPGFNVGWYENPRDHGGNARTDPWIFHSVGAYANYLEGYGLSYGAMDINGDGRMDIVTGISEGLDTPDGVPGNRAPVGGLIWWQAPVDRINGTWIKHTIDPTANYVHNIVIGDMNGDGTPDILAFEEEQSAQGRLMIDYNEGGTGQNWLVQTLVSDASPAIGGGQGGHNESVGDANGDGAMDILNAPHGYYTQVNPITLFLNQDAIKGIVKPVIGAAPVSQTVNNGDSVTFSVAATGTGPLTYQWQQNGQDIAGANARSYTLFSAPLTDDGSVFRCIVGNPAGLIPSAGATLGVNLTGNPRTILGSLGGSQATAASSYNLTTLGSSDWAHWGRGAAAGNFDHKTSGGSQISNVTRLGSGSYNSYYASARNVSWTDGTPLAADTGDDAYIWANNALGAGYSFTVPASTTSQTLYVYAGGYSSGGTLTAHLSDSSAGNYLVSASGSGLYTKLYTITFSAASAGQSLIVSYVKTTNINGTGGSVDLIAAALAGAPVKDTTPPTASVTTAPTLPVAGSAPCQFAVTYTDNVAVNALTLGNNNLLVTGSGYSQAAMLVSTGLSNGPTIVVTYSVPAPSGGWSNSSDGAYTIALQANQVADTSGNFAPAVANLGTFTVSTPAPGAGSLSGTQAAAASSYNLTSLGTSDWAHWGTGNFASALDHKAVGGSQISNVTKLGSGGYGSWYDPSRDVIWTDGTPLAGDSGDHAYIWANNAIGAGYSFTVPAGTTARRLYIYAGGYSSGGTLTAHLSSGAVADYVATASGSGLYTNLYTITFKAASAGQTLTISYVKSSNINGVGGSVDLIAAALV
jgi:hypothetical protein